MFYKGVTVPLPKATKRTEGVTNRVLRSEFGPNRAEVAGDLRFSQRPLLVRGPRRRMQHLSPKRREIRNKPPDVT